MIKNEVQIKLNTFEGPLDLLLFLIKTKKMDITELTLTKVANQFVEYVNNSEKINLDESSEYLLLASQLLEIKTKHLLNTEQGKSVRTDSKDSENLIKRLIEYERYKKMSEVIYSMYEKNPGLEKEISEYEDFVLDNSEHDYKLVSNGVIDIKRALSNIFKAINERKTTNTTLKVKRISIEQRRKQLQDFFIKNDSADFIELVSQSTSKYMIAVTLLCLLEMANSELVNLKQNEDGSIYITSLHKKGV